MTTDDRDMTLQTLFDHAAHELDGESFTDGVVSKTRRVLYLLLLAAATLLLVFLFCTWWFAVPVQQLSLLITQFLGTPLVELGETWVGWVFTPINNIASLLVVSGKLLRMTWKKLIGGSYL